MYPKELGMGIELISVGDIANSTLLSSHFLFFQSFFIISDESARIRYTGGEFNLLFFPLFSIDC
jgi:hypothetical protein